MDRKPKKQRVILPLSQKTKKVAGLFRETGLDIQEDHSWAPPLLAVEGDEAAIRGLMLFLDALKTETA